MISIALQLPIQVGKLAMPAKQNAEPDFSALLEKIQEECVDAFNTLKSDDAENMPLPQYTSDASEFIQMLQPTEELVSGMADTADIKTVDTDGLVPDELSISYCPTIPETPRIAQPEIMNAVEQVTVYAVQPETVLHAVQKELLVLPWRLMAGYNLDYSADHARKEVVMVGSVGHTAPSIPQVAHVLGAPREAINALASSDQSYESTSLQKLSVRAPLDMPHSELEHIASSRLELLAHTVPWSKQVLRWTVSPEGEETVWVRDYSLTAEQVNEMVSDIRKMAHEHTIFLSAIMVNGRQVWRNENTQSEVR